MSDRVVARACSNVALSKYWGKQAGAGNLPAVPSLSVTLGGLVTHTELALDDALERDELTLGGARTEGRPRDRAAALLARVRELAGAPPTAFARVASSNDFPTASGLASSASGFAALALGAATLYGLDVDRAAIAGLAREASASSGRSLFGGFVELDVTGAARQVAPPDHLPLRIVVAVATEGAKALGSTEGMIETARSSPYHAPWLAFAPGLHGTLKAALLAGDLARVGELAESSALAMHASCLAAGIVYVKQVTLDVLAEVRALRAAGLAAWASIDAGPHVKVLTSAADRDAVRARIAAVPGVLRTIASEPGPAASATREADPT